MATIDNSLLSDITTILEQNPADFAIEALEILFAPYDAEDIDTAFRDFEHNAHCFVEKAAMHGYVTALDFFINELGLNVYEDGAEGSLYLAAMCEHVDTLNFLLAVCENANLDLPTDLDDLHPHELPDLSPAIIDVFDHNTYYQTKLTDEPSSETSTQYV